MQGRLLLFFEDAQGRRVGDGPQWEAKERRFLWEVVHDTRGVMRRGVRAEHVNQIRQVEQEAEAGKGPPVDPAPFLEAYEAAAAALREMGAKGPVFHWIGPAGTGEWAAVHHFEDGGRALALIGGWMTPLLREASGSMEPIRSYSDGEEEVVVGSTRLAIRRESFYECFQQDLEGVVEALRRAVDAGHGIRFVQA